MGTTIFFLLITAFGLAVLVIESLGLMAGEMGDDNADTASSAADAADADYHDYLTSDATDENTYDGVGSEGIATGFRRSSRHVNLGSGIFRVLFALRMFVYFCCGFGPIGLTSTLVGQPFAVSVVAGVGAGLATMAMAAVWIRLQRNELDSTIPDRDLIGESASVIIPIAPGQTGRVRITVAQSVMDRYATAPDANKTLEKGDRVTVTSISGADVVVRALTTSQTLDPQDTRI